MGYDRNKQEAIGWVRSPLAYAIYIYNVLFAYNE